MKNKYRLISFIATALVCLLVIFLNFFSHKQTQKIYLEQTENIIVNLKKDYLKDTVNNIILEIDKLREKKYSSYKKNIEVRLRRLQEEMYLTDEEFVKFFINRFSEDINTQMWTAFLWNNNTGEVLYDSSELNMDIDSTVAKLKLLLSSYAVIEKGSVKGIFGVEKSYIDEIVKDEAGDFIRSIVFSNDSYLWVNEVINYEGGKDYAIRRVHPNLIETEGSYLSTDMEDIKGNKPYLEELEGVKKDGELFFNYYFKKLNSTEVSEKITYARLYKDYDWIIAMGVHLEEIDAYTKIVNKEIYSLSEMLIIKLLIYILIVLLIGFVIIYFVENKNISCSTKTLEKEINIDGLTKAYSRKYGSLELNKFFKEFKLTNESPAIMFIDIDEFKTVNNKYGHNVGDVVLIEIVKSINYVIRSSDYLIRWGGDEFVAILPGLKEEHIMEFGEKLLGVISSLRIPVENGDYINLGISIGFSYFRETDKDYKDVLIRADEALYMSKKQGKGIMNVIL